jgi:two-component sensor histidine kinase
VKTSSWLSSRSRRSQNIEILSANCAVSFAQSSAFAWFLGGSFHRIVCEEPVHTLWEKRYADEVVSIFRHTLQTGEPYATQRRDEFRIDRERLEYYEWSVERITLPDGSYRVVCYFRDIAEQVKAEETPQLLLRELNHRVKNTLASVQAIAHQTLRNTKDPAEFARRFSGRVQSMAPVHALLTESSWKGADLRELIPDQLLQGSVDETRLTAWGPAVQLEPQMAVHIAVMLHELGTNSIKYGALSAAKGWVKP